ncbi:MAG: SEC-C domain-containing protein [Nitrospinae bacterium]|nr:SEC-C domain-containing protein [Nitrospinota bacterium]
MVAVTGVHGTKHVPLYKMCIYIPNGVYFDSVHVTEGEIAGGDVLIGMDIISKGDFAVTNKENTTVFSFRIPSLEHIDFTQRVQTSNQPFLATRTPGRNEPCLCGSGKKYKRCCGKN